MKWQIRRIPMWLVWLAIGLAGLSALAGAKTWPMPLLGPFLGWYGPQLYLLWRQRRQ